MLAFPLPVPIRTNMPLPSQGPKKVNKVPKVKAKAKTGDKNKKGDGSQTSKPSMKSDVTRLKHVKNSFKKSTSCCSRIESDRITLSLGLGPRS